MKIAFLTFGCRLNRAEALDEEARLLAAGHSVVLLDGDQIPDLIVVRGCSVTAKAERDCRKAIARLRLRHPASRIQLAGCLTPSPSDSSLVTRHSSLVTSPPPLPLRTARAYLKVQDGCSGRCAFCIVPSFRGQPRSVPFDQVLARARAFLSAGYRELVVTGCNLALYRDAGHGLPDLLAALAMLGKNHRVRLSSLEPGVCDDGVLAAFAAHPNICRFIHLSIQSGANAVLARMNRPYAIETVDAFCASALRALGPRLALGADIIAGFPGETDEDFAATREFLQRYPFANLHVFPYSERPGTPAATMDGSIPPALRRARARELEKLGQAKRRAFAESFLGQNVEVCIESDNTGWTAEYLKCSFDLTGCKRPKDLLPLARRSLVQGRVVQAKGDRLVAVPLPPEKNGRALCS